VKKGKMKRIKCSCFSGATKLKKVKAQNEGGKKISYGGGCVQALDDKIAAKLRG